MIDLQLMMKLMKCFNGSFINQNGEFVAHAEANEYLCLTVCKNEFDIKCQMLEWFSRASYKTKPFDSTRKNDKFHDFMRDGINKFLGTSFDKNGMCKIYTHLGNACDHDKTIAFVESRYDMSVLD